MSGGHTDLFGAAVAPAPVRKTTLFGEGLDAIARQRGGWPDAAVAFAVEVIGKGEDPQVMVTGGVPIGHRADGYPKFGKRADDLRAVIVVSEYRAAISRATGEQGK